MESSSEASSTYLDKIRSTTKISRDRTKGQENASTVNRKTSQDSRTIPSRNPKKFMLQRSPPVPCPLDPARDAPSSTHRPSRRTLGVGEHPPRAKPIGLPASSLLTDSSDDCSRGDRPLEASRRRRRRALQASPTGISSPKWSQRKDRSTKATPFRKLGKQKDDDEEEVDSPCSLSNRPFESRKIRTDARLRSKRSYGEGGSNFDFCDERSPTPKKHWVMVESRSTSTRKKQKNRERQSSFLASSARCASGLVFKRAMKTKSRTSTLAEP